MKSTKYIKHRRSKYQFPTRVTKGSGKTKGRLRVGSVEALADIESKLGRPVVVARTAHVRGQWVFCELRK